MPWIRDWNSGDMEFHCPVCDSTQCYVVYRSNSEIIGCDMCIDREYVDDIEQDDDCPEDEF